MAIFYRVTFSALYLGRLIQNVVHFEDKVGQGSPPPSTATIAQDIAANWLPAQQLLHHTFYRWTSIECSEVRNPAPMPAHIEPVNFPGAGVGESHSVSCFKIRWITARGGRRGFGKYYVGGINWSLVEGNNQLSQTARDRLLAFCAAIESRYMEQEAGPVPFQMVLLHKDVNDPPNRILTCDFYPDLGVQRRRNE
jgi:hypothetical protein